MAIQKINTHQLNIECTWIIDKKYQSLELDFCAVMLNNNKNLEKSTDFIFYNNPSSACGSINIQDCLIQIDLTKIKSNITEILLFAIAENVSEYKSTRKQYFNMLETFSVNLNDKINVLNITDLDSKKEYIGETSVLFGRLFIENNEWSFDNSFDMNFLNHKSLIEKYESLNEKYVSTHVLSWDDMHERD